MPVSINGSGAITFNDGSIQNTAATGFGFKNRIINGAMVIDQRNAGASVTITNTSANTYTLDRWFAYGSAASKFSVQQNAGSVTPPTGFTNYLGVTSLAATSLGSTDQYVIGHFIEGFNSADLAWGTANAQPVTFSFWVRSSLTGTFGGSIRNAAFNRSYVFSYTINSANTWEQKTITITGDTSGTWLTNNDVGIRIYFGLGVGSGLNGTAGSWSSSNFTSATGATSVVGTNGATFYITGVQLEKGSTATSFDYRPYGTEELLCKRYFQAYVGSLAMRGVGGNASSVERMGVILPVEMRTTPTISIPTAIGWFDGFGVGTISSLSGGANYSNPRSVEFSANYASGSSATGRIIVGYVGVGTLTLSAEL